ncbi:hypothetical protein ES708_28495 [subsurface metagenome]
MVESHKISTTTFIRQIPGQSKNLLHKFEAEERLYFFGEYSFKFPQIIIDVSGFFLFQKCLRDQGINEISRSLASEPILHIEAFVEEVKKQPLLGARRAEQE